MDAMAAQQREEMAALEGVVRELVQVRVSGGGGGAGGRGRLPCRRAKKD